MASKKSGGLGRGLEALFEDTALIQEVSVDEEKQNDLRQEAFSDMIRYIDINDIIPNRSQPRRFFDEDKIQELADSIREHGMIQPIIVRSAADSGFEIVAGERRWRAARRAELRVIPCIVREITDRENMLLALIENMHREDLNPIEEASAFCEMMNRYGLTQAEVSKSVGRSRPYIANAVRLLKLPDAVQELVIAGSLSGGHARAIAGVEDAKMQIKLAELAKDGGLSVRALEQMISEAAEIQGDQPEKKHISRKKNPEIEAMEEELKSVLGTKVRLPNSTEKGKIEISFCSRVELDRLIELLRTLGS